MNSPKNSPIGVFSIFCKNNRSYPDFRRFHFYDRESAALYQKPETEKPNTESPFLPIYDTSVFPPFLEIKTPPEKRAEGNGGTLKPVEEDGGRGVRRHRCVYQFIRRPRFHAHDFTIGNSIESRDEHTCIR